MTVAREQALEAFVAWLKTDFTSAKDVKLGLHSTTIVEALMAPETPPTPPEIECRHWIACLQTLGFFHKVVEGEHVIEGHGFQKEHVGLKNIVVRIGHFLNEKLKDGK